MKYVKVATIDDLPEDCGLGINIQGEKIALFKVKNHVYAVCNRCPHRGAPLADGALRGTIVTCSWHGWDFDVAKGVNVVDQDIQLKSYPTKVKNSVIFVGIDGKT